MYAVQIARYVEGSDTSKIDEVAKIGVKVASDHGFELTTEAFANRLRSDANLRAGCLERMGGTQIRMNFLGIPQQVAVVNGKHILDGNILHKDPQKPSRPSPPLLGATDTTI